MGTSRWPLVVFVCALAFNAPIFAQTPQLPTVPQMPAPLPVPVPMSLQAPGPLTTPEPSTPTPSPADGSVEFPVEPLLQPFDWTQVRLGGQFRVEPNASNFSFHPISLPTNQPQQGYVLDRFRLWMTYSPSDNVEGYIQMQVGQIAWGTNYDFSKNFPGNFITQPDDRLGIQLRRGWLALKDENLGKLRIGILDWHDSFDDTLASSNYDFNTGGIDWVLQVKEMNNFRISLAALMLTDRAFAVNNNAPAPAAPGTGTSYLFALDLDQPIGKKFSVGSSAYYLYDRGGYSYPTAGLYSYSQDFWGGVRAKWNNDLIPVGGFFLVNTGSREGLAGNAGANHTGFASRIEVGPLKIGQGKLYAQAVYSTGGDGNGGGGGGGEFRTVAQSYRDNFGSQGYWSYLQITSPNAPGDVNDLGVGLQNRGLGLITLQSKFEYPLTKRLLSTTAGGYLRSDQPSRTSGSRVMGTEAGEMFTYDFGGGLKLDTGVAVMFTGDFYRPTPTADKQNTLYEVFSRLQLEF
jgi:hypothetical protein